MARRETVVSGYGTVDRVVLEDLRRAFDTARLLEAIDAAAFGEAGQSGHPTLYASLHCLHAMAVHVIDGAPAAIVSEQAIWQLAEEILDDLEASRWHAADVVPLVEQLAALRPHDD